MAVREVWVGIDVGKGFPHGCAVNEGGTVVFSRKVVTSTTGTAAEVV
ncbi:hypothetical protein [Amycolatopsis sp. NPDC051372]